VGKKGLSFKLLMGGCGMVSISKTEVVVIFCVCRLGGIPTSVITYLNE
jgi:hypothetical protein